MPIWKPMKSSADLPDDRAVLLRGKIPWGFRAPNESDTIHIGQRGIGRKSGVWSSNTFWPDAPGSNEIGTAVFTAFAEIPPFDGTE